MKVFEANMINVRTVSKQLVVCMAKTRKEAGMAGAYGRMNIGLRMICSTDHQYGTQVTCSTIH